MRFPRCLAILFLALCPVAFASAAEDSSLPVVISNDNRTPAGQLKNGVLNLQLEVREGRWYPEEETGVHREIFAFAEAGHVPQSPGPLLRVPQGTRIHATIRNTLPVAAKVYGLHRHPGDPKDAVIVAPGQMREVQFLAGEPGTYFYWATTSDKSIDVRDDKESLLSGAFVIDSAGAKPSDRVFVIGIWSKGLPGAPGAQEIAAINGKSWPYSERLSYKLGEATHWRVINPTASDHAMHLHGFYFTVDGEGDGEQYRSYPQEQRLRAVTQHIDVGHVFEMTWTPERAGNWLFHCHMVAHMSPEETTNVDAQPAAYSSAHEHGMGMAGLVLGITVSPGVPPPAGASSAAAAAHKVRLVVSDNPGKVPLYTLAVDDPRQVAVPDKSKPPSLMGPPIVLTRGETAEIEVKNQSTHPTVIHWHGMEIESYYDGVAGWTGSGQQITPPIAPGSSFVARMTPPRAGTFIYHTHWHDSAQILNGLYGPLIVLEPGQQYDPEHDRAIVFGEGKYDPFGYLLLVNGHPQPDPIDLHIGTVYRLRFINITDNGSDLRVRLSNGAAVQWKVIAKDGAELPPAQVKWTTADMGITVGETYDVEYRAESPGLVNLDVWEPSFPSRVTLPLNFVAAK